MHFSGLPAGLPNLPGLRRQVGLRQICRRPKIFSSYQACSLLSLRHKCSVHQQLLLWGLILPVQVSRCPVSAEPEPEPWGLHRDHQRFRCLPPVLRLWERLKILSKCRLKYLKAAVCLFLQCLMLQPNQILRIPQILWLGLLWQSLKPLFFRTIPGGLSCRLLLVYNLPRQLWENSGILVYTARHLCLCCWSFRIFP